MLDGVDGQVVLVLGSHRSGTSAITRVINLLGVDLGPEDRLIGPGAPQNLKGFFESRPIMLLNDRLLAELGGTWRDPPRLEQGWEHDHALDALKTDAGRIVKANFSDRSAWGFKDPRVCITLPFWLDLLGPADCLICHRDPLEVARSIQRRDGISQRHGIDLWATYTAAAIVNTVGARRMFVGFSELFTNRDEVLKELAGFVGAAGRDHDPELVSAVDDWLEADLKHHSSGLELLLAEPDVPEEVRALAVTLELAVRARAAEAGLRGDVPAAGPVSSALDAAARTYLKARNASEQRAVRAPRPYLPPAAGFEEPRTSPDWLIVGAPTSGSVALAELTAEHPDLTAPADLSTAPHRTATELAELAYRSAPEAKLVLLIRDPIARAVDQHRLATEAGLERRGPERALREQLTIGALRGARLQPSRTNSYLVDGEYGRIASAFLQRYRAAQLLVLDADALERDPSPAVGRLLRFLGVDDSWRPDDLKRRARLGGDSALVPAEAASNLIHELDETVFPLAGARAIQARRSFERVFESWSRTPAGSPGTLADDLQLQLASHFARDARELERVTGITVAWGTAPGRLSRAVKVESPDLSIAVIVDDLDDARTAVQSVCTHTVGPFELLLVPAGGHVCADLDALARAAGARVVTGSVSVAAARNAAIQQAGVDELVLLSGDCVVTDGWLANLRAALASADDVVLVGPRSNCAEGEQGGIWLDQVCDEEIARFARAFNHPDPARWFESDRLGGFALLARRLILAQLGGFDSRIGDPSLADRDLAVRLRGLGYRLICAGDTFVFHAGHEDFRLALAAAATTRSAGQGDHEPGRLLRDPSGSVFEVDDGAVRRIASDAAMRLIRDGRPVDRPHGGELDQPGTAPLVMLCREIPSHTVWLLDGAQRRRVTGDPHRIRRLPNVAVGDISALEPFTEGPSVAVEDALPPVVDLEPPLAGRPRRSLADREPGLDPLVGELDRALADRRGYAMIRLGVGEARTLSEGVWPVPGPASDGWSAPERRPTPVQLRTAIGDSDAVGLPAGEGWAATRLASLLTYHDLYPPLCFDRSLIYDLLGFEQETGRETGTAPLRELLAGRRVAVVGRLAQDARRLADKIGYDVGLAVAFDGPGELETALTSVAAARDAFDAVLVAAGLSSRVLCSRLARELDVVSIDLGYAFDRLLYERFGPVSAADLEARWAAERYVRECAEPPAQPPHALEGQLVREPGDPAVFMVERGKARRVTHKALLDRLGQGVSEVAPELLAELPRGLPLCVVRGYDAGQPYLLIAGRKVPLRLGLPAPLPSSPLVDLLPGGPPIDWFPGAPVD